MRSVMRDPFALRRRRFAWRRYCQSMRHALAGACAHRYRVSVHALISASSGKSRSRPSISAAATSPGPACPARNPAALRPPAFPACAPDGVSRPHASGQPVANRTGATYTPRSSTRPGGRAVSLARVGREPAATAQLPADCRGTASRLARYRAHRASARPQLAYRVSFLF